MKYQLRKKALLLLEDETIFWGRSVGIEGVATGELCFNTGMTGYQEIFTDPSYHGQLMLSTNAHIGNYGVTSGESESESIKISGLICRNFSYIHSRERANQALEEWFAAHRIPVITQVDTRAVVRHIRSKGAMNALIATQTDDIASLKKILRKTPDMKGLELVSQVSVKKAYCIGDPHAPYKIAALDLGIKRSILRQFVKRACYIKVFPYDTAFEELQKWNPDAYFLSNGPGDPEPLIGVQQTVKKILEKNIPLFGICLGHQLIALANGIPTYKMHNGHRGINHPVKNLISGKGEITSQNHGFAVEKKAVEQHPDFEITHIHLNDGTVAGMKMLNKSCFSVQYHPEAGPGPHDASYLFDQFITNINQYKKVATNECNS